MNIRPADQYGGAGGQGSYAVSGLGTTSSYSISFDQSLTYFGFWLSALDGGNHVIFYSGGDEVFSFSPVDVLNLVSGMPDYRGNPNGKFSGQNRSEPYVFLNFFADDAYSFDKIVFKQTNGAGYESDNHTVGIWKEQSGTVVPNSQVPEPSSLLLLMGALLGVAGTRTLRRQA
ncbi:PEP-CTERM sorting domain-containing protein [Thauera sp.]|uniref:Npun_F0296 family exosortase-dependent surface protein n=1 Tax=Thauera sp. TaxID=1905334 RepID=UPI0039E6415C